MSMGMFLRPTMRVEQRCEQRLSVEQRLQLGNYLFGQRLRLIEVVHNEHYEPKAFCPHCNRRLTPAEILKGFTDDVNDLTTACPTCKTRFRPMLINFGNASKAEVGFYCPRQTLERLKGKERMKPDDIRKALPAVYHSALVHYGNIAAAFRALGIKYKYQKMLAWQEKVKPFLGRLPDSQIAKCAGVSVPTLAKYRRSLGIDPYTCESAKEAAGI